MATGSNDIFTPPVFAAQVERVMDIVGPARKVYAITDAGRETLIKRAQSWRQFAQAIERLMPALSDAAVRHQQTATRGGAKVGFSAQANHAIGPATLRRR